MTGNLSLAAQLKFPGQWTSVSAKLEGLAAASRNVILESCGDRPALMVERFIMAPDFTRYLAPLCDQSVGILGSIKPENTTSDEMVSAFANLLMLHDSGAIIMICSYMLLLFPSGSDRWDKVKGDLSSRGGSSDLTYLLCKPPSDIFSQASIRPDTELDPNRLTGEQVLSMLGSFGKNTENPIDGFFQMD
jgi:hypothetical protein